MNTKSIGVSADSPWLYYAYPTRKNGVDQIESRPLGGYGSFPNAILLPRIEGESFRIDLGSVPHPRGSGLQWPNEAVVDPRNGAGRLPIGMIMDRIGDGNTVQWGHDNEASQYSCSDALTGALSQVSSTFDGNVVFVVPNHWNVELQQTVLDSFQKENIKCKLLWRPIAAAIEWVHEFRHQIDKLARQEDGSFGKLLSIYVGLGDLEITELELVDWTGKNGDLTVVPGRKRPTKHERVSGFGFRQIIQKIAQETNTLRNPLLDIDDRFGCLWNQLWCSQNLDRYISNFQFSRTTPLKIDEVFEKALCGTPQIDPIELAMSLLPRRVVLNRNYSGIVISGPIANGIFDDRTSVVNMLLDSLDTHSDMILIEGRNIPKGLLARGANRFGRMVDEGLPTYLDTLPRLEMVVSERGEPAWIDLLEPGHKWVDGGRTWQRPEWIKNLKIKPRSDSLEVVVYHEDFSTVRQIYAELPEKSAELERVALSIQMTPAQGNARLELHPEKQDLFGRHSVFVDWRKMTELRTNDGKPMTKQHYLNGQHRIYPELLSRISSESKIRNVQASLTEIKAMMLQPQSDPEAINWRLACARSQLREKDQSLYPRDATAFDSEGNCASQFKLDEFMAVAWPYFCRHPMHEFIRAIAYTHVNHAEFHEFIYQRINNNSDWDDHILAAGKCFRNPIHIAGFVKSFLTMQRFNRITQTWWKALSEMLRFRGNATQCVTSDDCIKLIDSAFNVFVKQRNMLRTRELFRQACLVIVYTLRRRAFDDSFLDPESELAINIKSEIQTTRDDIISGRLRAMGGAVNLPEQLQLIVDYIDRQGRGQLLISD
jgi:hypothetical protein